MRYVFIILFLSLANSAFATEGNSCLYLFVESSDEQKLIHSLAELRLNLDHAITSNDESLVVSALQRAYRVKETKALALLGISRQKLISLMRVEILEMQKQRELIDKEEKRMARKHAGEINGELELGEKIVFSFVPGGELKYGNGLIVDSFDFMSTHVTQYTWEKVATLANEILGTKIDPTPSKHANQPLHPVENILGQEVQAWIDALNELAKIDLPQLKELIPDHKINDVYRLPEDTEWNHVFYSSIENIPGLYKKDGSIDFSVLENYFWQIENEEKSHTQLVGSKRPVRIGMYLFYDVLGNATHITHSHSFPGQYDLTGGPFGAMRQVKRTGTSGFRLARKAKQK